MLHQKPKKKTPKHPFKKNRSSIRAEHGSYQAGNSLTKYVERVNGINSTEKN